VNPVSTSILSTGLSRAIVISTALFVAAIAATFILMQRYMIILGARAETPVAYRLDTLTGRMSFCTPLQCSLIPTKEDAGG